MELFLLLLLLLLMMMMMHTRKRKSEMRVLQVTTTETECRFSLWFSLCNTAPEKDRRWPRRWNATLPKFHAQRLPEPSTHTQIVATHSRNGETEKSHTRVAD